MYGEPYCRNCGRWLTMYDGDVFEDFIETAQGE